MRYRPRHDDPTDPRLGRFLPDDWDHLAQFPFSAVAQTRRQVPVPIVIGVNWYDAFFRPRRDEGTGEWWIARDGSWGDIAGGHAVCLEPGGSLDEESWYDFYDQGREGACVGFAWSRCMSLFNKELYSARWLWDRSKEIDQWPDTNPGDDNGTSVRAAAAVLLRRGHVDWEPDMADDDVSEREDYTPATIDGIARVRWARSVEEVHAALANPEADRLEAVPFLNSWGRSYPRRTWMPDTALARLIDEDGEIAVPTDR